MPSQPSVPPPPAPSWAEARDETLDRLAARLRPAEFFGFREQLLTACADVLARSDGRDLVFLGRSAESLYDLLRCLLYATRRAPRLVLVPFSYRHDRGTATKRAATAPAFLDDLARHFDELGLGPTAIADHPRGLTFVDVTCWGTTFGSLDELLTLMAVRRGVDPRAVAAKVRFVGLAKASLGWTHWRADEESQGARFFAEGRADVVPLSNRLWRELADHGPKTMETYTADLWGAPPRIPPLDGDRRDRAVRRAAELVDFGRSSDGRRAFAAALGRRARGQPWLGSLVTGLLRSTQLHKRRRPERAQRV